jgi:hypothetical protein
MTFSRRGSQPPHRSKQHPVRTNARTLNIPNPFVSRETSAALTAILPTFAWDETVFANRPTQNATANAVHLVTYASLSSFPCPVSLHFCDSSQGCPSAVPRHSPLDRRANLRVLHARARIQHSLAKASCRQDEVVCGTYGGPHSFECLDVQRNLESCASSILLCHFPCAYMQILTLPLPKRRRLRDTKPLPSKRCSSKRCRLFEYPRRGRGDVCFWRVRR